jgi:peptide/nickel transport system substrate-binding protein
MTMRNILSCAVGAAALAASVILQPAFADDLKVAFSAPATTLDPHFQNASQNIGVSRNIFEALVQMDPDSRIVPGLAESWRRVDDKTWEFKLRRAKFHDGSDLTAEDVAYSLDRPATIPNSPSSFAIYTKSIVEKRIIDPQTIQLVTAQPYPLLLSDLTSIFIVSKKATEGLKSEDFSSGKGVDGTGPYKFVSYTPDDRVTLERFDGYWAGKPSWDNVQIRFIPNDASRLTALLSGDVNAIENVPTPDLEKVKNDPNLTFAAKKSHRVIFLFLDSGRDNPPNVAAHDGKPLDKNPLKDVRVRQAINLAIDRKGIRDRIMQGLAYPTNNLVTEQMQGFIAELEDAPYNPEKARKLLAEAGYPEGFRLTLAAPNNRFINDERVAQAIAQMLTRIGIRTQVDAMPFTVINTRAGKGEFPSSMMGWGAQTAEASSPIRAMIACPDKEKGWGPVNWGNYCNKELDQVLAKAISTLDDAQRETLLKDAVKRVVDDVAIVPLYFQASTWAAKKGIAITPRTDERTSAQSFEPAK